jgi:hypothetical protein
MTPRQQVHFDKSNLDFITTGAGDAGGTVNWICKFEFWSTHQPVVMKSNLDFFTTVPGKLVGRSTKFENLFVFKSTDLTAANQS